MQATEVYDDSHDCQAVEFRGDHVFAKVLSLDDDGRFGYVDWIEVDEGFRGQGIGSAAIKELANKYCAIYLAPTDANNARLYGRLGEQVIGKNVDADEDTFFYGQSFDSLYYLDQGFGVYEVA